MEMGFYFLQRKFVLKWKFIITKYFKVILNKTQQLIDLENPSNRLSPSKRPSLFRSPSERQRAEVKPSLTRSLSLDVAMLRTILSIPTELTFERRPRVKKMVTIKLEEAFKLIPLCTGEDDIYSFINACEMAVNLVEEKFAPTLVKHITTRLCGRALEMIKYKNVTKWVCIKSYLTDAFEDTTTASSLQIQLNSIKMCNDEDVNDYYHRVKKLYYKLCTAYMINKEDAEAKVIHETLKEQTLAIFIKGLIAKTIIIFNVQIIKEIITRIIISDFTLKGNVNETIGTLLETLKDYHIVTEIAHFQEQRVSYSDKKNYNVTLGINYEIKRKVEINSFLPVSKIISDTPFVVENDHCQKSTYENNIYIALLNLKQLHEEYKLDKKSNE
ncbi:myb-like protein D [Aphis craccivora]|uniref:Myb-like protein D n=1 Tax=Aphis craccivora TaxID=307492 RepID=A0A6G0Y0S2_APHCR|nr:myb-like protein D [Aphis craccivora]